MQVSEERLQGVDRELSALGKSDDEVHAILARVADQERPGLAAVDEELEALAADAASVDAVLAAARARVPSALRQSEEVAVDVDVEVVAPVVAKRHGYALPPDDEPEQHTEVHARPPVESAAVRPVLVETDLFGESDSHSSPPGSSNLADLFGDEPGDPLDALDDPQEDLEHDLYDDEEPDHTSVFTVDEVRAIERESLTPGRPVAAVVDAATYQDDDDEDVIMSSAVPAPVPAKDQLDADLDEMLGESIRAGSVSIAEAVDESETDAADDDFELLVDDDILVVEEVIEEAPPVHVASAIPPPPPLSVAPPADGPKAEPDEDGEAPKKGFFKKLFGGGSGDS